MTDLGIPALPLAIRMRGLDVVPVDLVDQDRHRRVPVEPGVGTASIVGIDPTGQ